MPRGFNEREKQKIKQSLMDEGKRFFGQFGLKKTSVNDLVKAVGIAPGSFYIFFNSKEELYFEILELEEERIKNEFINYEIGKAEDTKQSIKNLLLQTFDILEKSPLISQLYFENNHQALLRKLPQEKLEEHFNKDSDTLAIITSKWKDEGILQSIDDDVLAGLFRSLFTMSLHKKEIGESVYPQTLELLLDLVVEGLVIGEG